jgi:hypothetical protein
MIALSSLLLEHSNRLSSVLDRPEREPPCPGRVADKGNRFAKGPPMSTDALSDVLSAVQLSGSVFFDITARSPWVAEAPPAAQIANEVMPGAQHVIEYHVVTRGTCWISLVGDIAFEPVKLDEGDIAVIPQGDPHAVSSAPGMRAEPNLEVHRRPEDANALPFAIQTGGDGPSDTHLICGFFSCDARPFNPLLDSLPRFMRFTRDPSQGSHSLLDHFIRSASAETGNKRPGSQSVLNRLSELMFVEQQHRLAGWIAGSAGRPRADAAARAPYARVDAGGARFGSCCLTIGAGRSFYPNCGLSAYPVPHPMAHADRRQAACGARRQDCRCRPRNRLRIRSRIQPGVQEISRPVAEPMATSANGARNLRDIEPSQMTVCSENVRNAPKPCGPCCRSAGRP